MLRNETPSPGMVKAVRSSAGLLTMGDIMMFPYSGLHSFLETAFYLSLLNLFPSYRLEAEILREEWSQPLPRQQSTARLCSPPGWWARATLPHVRVNQSNTKWVHIWTSWGAREKEQTFLEKLIWQGKATREAEGLTWHRCVHFPREYVAYMCVSDSDKGESWRHGWLAECREFLVLRMKNL